MLICIDEIDAFSGKHSVFVDVLKKLLRQKPDLKIKSVGRKIVASNKPEDGYCLTVVGIANSVELFQGEIMESLTICNNELRLLFKPYTKDGLANVLRSLACEAIPPSCSIDTIIHNKAFLMAASKIDQVSGDIRVCFEIMRQVVQQKLENNNFDLITIHDTNRVILDMFQSKIVKIV